MHKKGYNDDQGTRIAGETSKPTGAGAEAAEGIHGAPRGRQEERAPSDQTSIEQRQPDDEKERPGSEPLSDSEQHRSRYGGGGRR
jgi:hypothetical protein